MISAMINTERVCCVKYDHANMNSNLWQFNMILMQSAHCGNIYSLTLLVKLPSQICMRAVFPDGCVM